MRREEMEAYTRLREGLNLLMSSDQRTARHNTIPVTRNTSEAHWWALTKVARELVKQGCTVICEARFNNKLRADIYVPELKLVVEVMESEGIESIREKALVYATLGVRVGWFTTSELDKTCPESVVFNVVQRSRSGILGGGPSTVGFTSPFGNLQRSAPRPEKKESFI